MRAGSWLQGFTSLPTPATMLTPLCVWLCVVVCLWCVYAWDVGCRQLDPFYLGPLEVCCQVFGSDAPPTADTLRMNCLVARLHSTC